MRPAVLLGNELVGARYLCIFWHTSLTEPAALVKIQFEIPPAD